MKKLLKYEILYQNKIQHLIKHYFLFLLFALISTIIIMSPENFTKFGIALSVIYIPLFLMNINYFLIKEDIHNGNLEFLLSCCSAWKIILSKFSATSFNGIISLLMIMPIILLFFAPELELFLIYIICSVLILLLSCALIILIACIQSYFRNNTNFLTVMILPLIFPNIIFIGMIIDDPENSSLALVMLGIDMLIIPSALFLSQYLLENIYNPN